MLYRELFETKSVFFRSVRVDRDADQVHGYLVTPLFGSVLERLLRGLAGTGSRALTITGPYGTGKSATILHAARLLSSPDPALIQQLAPLRPDLAHELRQTSPVDVVLISCQPGRLGPQILEHLKQWAAPRKGRGLTRTLNHTDPANMPSVITAIQSAVGKSAHGLMLVLDEFGKPLEFAASHPDGNDIFLLQLLAEEATRSPQHHPMMIVAILHQSFEQYAHRHVKTQREEFAKIQGRLEDMAFQLNMSDVMRIIGMAVSATRHESLEFNPILHHVDTLADSIAKLGMTPVGLSQKAFRTLCQEAAPLHPAVTLLLAPLFRQFAQNERSVFGFLGSSEPHGFQNFLDSVRINATTPQLYTLSDLFDYLALSVGASMYHGPYSRRWADLDTALQRVRENQDAVRLVKTLGLIDLVQGHSLVASREALSVLAGGAIDEALPILDDRSIVVYRRFTNSYRLWSGSDIDIEDRLAKARSEAIPSSLSELLIQLTPPKPLVARKYSMETGTLRWFEVTFCEPEHLTNLTHDLPPAKADGRIYFVLGQSDDRKPESAINQHPWQIVCWLPIAESLSEATWELHYLDWVKAHTPEIADDETVAREISERQIELERIIIGALDKPLYDTTNVLDVWSDGIWTPVYSEDFNRFLSDRCQTLFPKTPHIRSEFVNRHELSSAAAAARNDVLQRMIERPHDKDLGLTGFPPQLPIYLATLRQGLLHQCVQGQWQMTAPHEGPWHETWVELTHLVETQYHPINEIWTHLSAPPFGVRPGLLPILTLAFILTNQNRLSLQEDGVFVPDVSMPFVERMMKSPHRFQMRLMSLTDRRQQLVKVMAQQRLLPGNYDDRNLLGIVRPLLVFVQRLPQWSRTTTKITEPAQKVRQVLLTAKEPADLLFRDLPRALDFPAVDDMVGDDVLLFTEQLRIRLQELADTYPALLNLIEERLTEAFTMSHDMPLATLRQTLRNRALRLTELMTHPEIKTVAFRIVQDTPDQPWLEGVASAISGRTPKSWSDRNVQEFTTQVYVVARQFEHYDTVAAAIPTAPYADGVVRIGITTPQGDWETVISPTVSQEKWAKNSVKKILQDIMSQGEAARPRLLLLAAELVNIALRSDANSEEVLTHE